MKIRLVFGLICVVSAFALVFFGLVGISAATQPGYEFSGFMTDYVRTQLIAFAAGLLVGLIILYVGFAYVVKVAPYLAVFNVVLLLITLVIGEEAYGAQRWISLGSFQFQPSELAKLSLPLLLVWINGRFSGVKKWAISLVGAMSYVVLVLVQPDLGTSIVLLVEFIAYLIIEGVNWGILLSGLYIVILAFPILWDKALKEYQKRRLLSFLNPFDDPSGSGYNLIQAWTAIGSGGLKGKGLDNAYFLYYGYLPVDHADFIFATISYVLGFWGAVSLLALMCSFVLGGVGFAFFVPDSKQKEFCFIVLCAWLIQFAVNIGMNLGLMPITGIPLPFISYGGSALLMNMVMLFTFLSYRPEPETH
ncbi:FtsW/RodA/SpoVE family cell cycle protein [Coprothermobacter proteolyticus]|nr:FtsW/RodA/SpoVE family cell cycle protein [Coprothermobacter proteolyticus]